MLVGSLSDGISMVWWRCGDRLRDEVIVTLDLQVALALNSYGKLMDTYQLLTGPSQDCHRCSTLQHLEVPDDGLAL